MRKLFYLVVSIVIFGLIISGCIFHMVPPLGQDGSIDILKDATSCKIDLIAGQHTIAGSITVSNDDENLFVTYETSDGWLMNETHLYVGTTIPTNSTPGKFPYKHEELGGVATDTYEIALGDLGVGPCDIVYIAAHAELYDGIIAETGWAEGVEIIADKNWAMYFKYRLSCDVVQEILYIHNLTEEKLKDIAEDTNINNIEDILNNLRNYLEEQEGIDSVVLNDNSLHINYESGVVSSIVLHDTSAEPFLGNIGQNSTSSILFNKQARKEDELVSKSVISDFKMRADENIEYIHNHNILIWAPVESIASNNILGYGNYGIISGLEDRFAESNLNFTVNSLADEDADIDSLQTITDYGMVFLFSHGADSGWLETGEVVKDSNAYRTEIEDDKSMEITQHYWIEIAAPSGSNLPNFTLIKKGKLIYSVNVNWFNNNLSNKIFPNTIIVNLSCESFNLPLYLCNTFIGRNAGAYYGFEGRVGAKFAQQRAYELAENLRDGDKTTGEAYIPSTDWLHGTAWKMTGKENLKFSKNTLSSIEVFPETMTLVEGDSQSIDSIIAYYEDGSTANISLDTCNYDPSNTGVATVNAGVITAINEGTTYIFTGYTEEGIRKTDTVEVTVTPATPNIYTITASAGSHGSISPSGNVTVNQGSDKSFTITPDNGYIIDDVLVDGSSVGAVSSYTFNNVTEDHTISATFISVAPGPVHNLTKDIYYDTIQAAIDNADSGNTIIVSPGIYHENVILDNKELIISSLDPNDPNIVSDTIIDGEGNGTVFTIENVGSSTKLTGFTLKNGNTQYSSFVDRYLAAGIFINNASPIIKFNIILNNMGHYRGAGLGIVNNSSPLIENNTICENETLAVGSGGGIYIGVDVHGVGNNSPIINGNNIYNNTAGGGGGISIGPNSTPLITNNSIYNNSSRATSMWNYDDYGGGICIAGSSPIIKENSIYNNHSHYGAGLIIVGNNSSPIIENNDITENYSSLTGGGILIRGCSDMSRIENNNISKNSCFIRGGGLYIENPSSSPNIINNIISENTSNYDGGGIGIYNSSPKIESNTISNNVAYNTGGGGIAIYNNSSPIIINNTILGNSTKNNGGGITINDSSPKIESNTISVNVAGNMGGGIYYTIENSDMSDVIGNIICGNNTIPQCYPADPPNNTINTECSP